VKTRKTSPRTRRLLPGQRRQGWLALTTTEAVGEELARIRSLKPEFWTDRKLARQHSRDARMLYMALWNQADEHGRVLGDPRWIKGNCLPYEDDIDNDGIVRLLDELTASGRVQRYAVDEDPYLFLPKLARHQRLESAKVPSRLPAPPDQEIQPENTPPEPRADFPARDTDEPEPDTDELSLLYVAGSRGQVAGGREHGSSVAVGENRDRNAHTREAAPAAQPEDFLARKLIGSIPRYRAAPGWAKRHLADLAGTALAAGFGANAITGYAVMVITEGRFQPHQHIPELRDALRRLNRDAALGTACRACGFDPGDCPCHGPAADDRPWTAEDQAALERALEHLGLPGDLAREA
jgi:hypothetical protein